MRLGKTLHRDGGPCVDGHFQVLHHILFYLREVKLCKVRRALSAMLGVALGPFLPVGIVIYLVWQEQE